MYVLITMFATLALLALHALAWLFGVPGWLIATTGFGFLVLDLALWAMVVEMIRMDNSGKPIYYV